MTTKTHNGHKNRNHWNVSLWINNDEGLYNWAKDCIRHNRRNRRNAAKAMLAELRECGYNKTPDGTPYSISSIQSAMVGM